MLLARADSHGIMQGYTYAETKEMGGRQARDQLKMKLPEFTARTSKIGKTSSGTVAYASLSSPPPPNGLQGLDSFCQEYVVIITWGAIFLDWTPEPLPQLLQ